MSKRGRHYCEICPKLENETPSSSFAYRLCPDHCSLQFSPLPPYAHRTWDSASTDKQFRVNCGPNRKELGSQTRELGWYVIAPVGAACGGHGGGRLFAGRGVVMRWSVTAAGTMVISGLTPFVDRVLECRTDGRVQNSRVTRMVRP